MTLNFFEEIGQLTRSDIGRMCSNFGLSNKILKRTLVLSHRKQIILMTLTFFEEVGQLT